MKRISAGPLSFILVLALAGSVMAFMQGCSKSQQGAAPSSTQSSSQSSSAQTGQGQPAGTGTVTCADSESSTGTFPPIPTVIDKTCAAIPLDMNGTPEQSGADLYSWLTFVAVNWPVDATTCTADPNTSILSGPQNPTWLTFLSSDEVFVPAPKTPANWCYSPGATGKPGAAMAKAKFTNVEAAVKARHDRKLAELPPKVRALAQKHPEVQLFLHHSSKAHDLLLHKAQLKLGTDPELQGILDATGEPVVDQNGRFVRYTINIGEDEYSYIMAQNLWKKSGQPGQALSFPYSRQTSATELGAMEFKAAWKVLGANDNPAHFFTQQAIVYNDDNGSPSPGPNPVTVGLVGLHITHKTQKQQKWLWATFEQVENDTQSFFNPNCPEPCPPNVETATQPYFELNPDGTPHNKPVQVVPAVQTTAASLNKTFQGLLPNTPWAYYKLISTQWVGELGSAPKPPKLGNSVLETFVAKTNPYSCMDCHAFARDSKGFKSDFSFIIHALQ